MWRQSTASDKQKIAVLESQTTQQLEVLIQHMGRIEADLMRINALGERLVAYAGLDPQEFNFGHEVGLGGADLYNPLAPTESMLVSLISTQRTLNRRLSQMQSLYHLLHTQSPQAEHLLQGKSTVVTNGWISSFFGMRLDPFSGRKAFHAGVDIAGKEGGEVKALASGIVSFASEKGAYGRLVEINHGQGLATRYGHNKSVLVKAGQLVKKGQAIALLGSSGRSTGPHVHLEVHQDGTPVDPGQYFPDLKRI